MIVFWKRLCFLTCFILLYRKSNYVIIIVVGHKIYIAFISELYFLMYYFTKYLYQKYLTEFLYAFWLIWQMDSMLTFLEMVIHIGKSM